MGKAAKEDLKMPFKLKLKKSRRQQYDVASRNMYVIAVELLDHAMLECTLTADSTGRDCMDNVCQRLGLQQPDLFGLRYISRRSYPKIRWVDLDRPLKKQLDKYAQEPYLYLSVMFYVNDVSLLEDEVTRYHYFLQLKMDVIEGRLRCNYEQAIVLASYSLQAEFGDHDPEKHTLEYLQDFALLPKPMMSQFPEEKLGTLTDAIISQHMSLRGIAQQLAEVYYIVGAQQLDGYGQECFLAKDDTGNEVLIGASLTGIVVRKGNVLSPQFFKWHDITNLVNHKRYFGVECQNYEYSVQFLLDEPDSAKYVWKMCVLQHTFYKMHAASTESNELNIKLGGVGQQQHHHHHSHQPKHSSLAAAAALPLYPANTNIQHSEIQSFHLQQTQSVNNTTLQSYNNYVLGRSSTSLHEEQQQQHRPVPDYETAVRNKYGMLPAQNNMQFQVYTSQPSLITDALLAVAPQQQQQHQSDYSQHQQLLHHNNNNAYSSTPELNRNTEATQEQIVAELQRLNLYKPPPPYPGPYGRLSSASTPDLAGVRNNHNNSNNVVVGLGGSSPDLVSRRNNFPIHNNNRDLHRTFDDLHRDYRNAYSTEELNFGGNNVGAKAHLIREANFLAPYHQQQQQQQHQRMLSQSCNEPIYQNQQFHEEEPIYQNLPVHEKELYKQRMLLQQQQQQQQQQLDSEGIVEDETVDSALLVVPKQQQQQQKVVVAQDKLKGHVSRVAITNSRDNLHNDSNAISSNMNFVYDEDLSHHQQQQQQQHLSNAAEGGVAVTTAAATTTAGKSGQQQQQQQQKSVTKISIGAGSGGGGGENLEQQQQQRRKPSREEDTRKNSTTSSHSAALDNYLPEPELAMLPSPRTPGQKPRAGRKRWALNFGSKTGSLKSVKSEGSGSGSQKHKKSQQDLTVNGNASVSRQGGFGPLMMATLHGLTRSRPDLLAESMATFSQPSKMPKEEIGAYLSSKLEQGEVLREFERIPKKKLQNCSFNCAVLAENIPRSRFKDVLPYDENRVKLTAFSDKENRTGFINASNVSASVGPDQRFYIAAQGPLPNTILHFWQMILQCDVHLIVMLTNDPTSCIPYWPQKDGSTLELGDFKIVKKFGSKYGNSSYATSTLHVTHMPSKRQRTLWHLQYSDWSENGCPSDVGQFVSFLEEMSSLRQLTATEVPAGRNRNPPVLVHCSAGVGRTGVAILCDVLLYCVDHNLEVDVPKVLTHLRQQRMLMVQTVAQYKFVHTVLIHYLKQSRLI